MEKKSVTPSDMFVTSQTVFVRFGLVKVGGRERRTCPLIGPTLLTSPISVFSHGNLKLKH